MRKSEKQTVGFNMPEAFISVEMEQELLGCLLQDGNNDAFLSIVDIIEMKHFYFSKHQDIFTAMVKIAFGSGSNIDVVTVVQQLRDDRIIWMEEVAAYTTSLFHVAITSSNIKQYAECVRIKYKLRELWRTSIVNMGIFHESGDDQEIYGKVEKEIMDTMLRLNIDQKQSMSLKDLYYPTLTEIQEYTERRSHKILPSGVADVDTILGGWRAGLIVMAGLESIGKTTMALNFTYKLLTQGFNGLFFSFETGGEFLSTRLACMESRTNIADFIGRRLTAEQYKNLQESLKKVCENYQLIINDKSNCSVLDIISKTKLEKIKNKISFIVVDHLQRISPMENIGLKYRTQQVTQDIMMLKALSMELEIPIFVISTLNNDGGLRESRMINYEADVIMFLSRGKNPDGTVSDEMQLEIKKHRFGDIGKIELLYYREGNIYEDYYTEERK